MIRCNSSSTNSTCESMHYHGVFALHITLWEHSCITSDDFRVFLTYLPSSNTVIFGFTYLPHDLTSDFEYYTPLDSFFSNVKMNKWCIWHQILIDLPKVIIFVSVQKYCPPFSTKIFLIYRKRAIISRSRFETALVYKPRIFSLKKVSCITSYFRRRQKFALHISFSHISARTFLLQLTSDWNSSSSHTFDLT